ncbi:MAG TPA: hypothetical protein VL961_11710, partial [Acidimicrobiales bacterium]|nr:hypothetical protein [Acidimicrobiales bacterium]
LPTESVDVLPTICDFMGTGTPLQADGWSLEGFLHGKPAPEHWRTAAHFEWDFSDPEHGRAERYFGIPMAHCSLAVSRGADRKYVQFASSTDVLAPLLFDLNADPQQMTNLAASKSPDMAESAWQAAQELLQWRMRSSERTLSGHFLSPGKGLVTARDEWW